MTLDEFGATTKAIASECGALRRKNKALIREHDDLADKAGISHLPFFQGSPDWKLDKMTMEEKCEEWNQELQFWKELDASLPSKVSALKENVKVKRSCEASQQKVGGMSDEVTFCNTYVTISPERKRILHGRSKRPEGLNDGVVVSSDSEKRDVTLITDSGEYRLSLKGDIDIVQWCLHATNEVGDYWGKESPYYKFCMCREEHHDKENSDVLKWVETNVPSLLDTCKKMYGEGIDKKTIYAFLRKHHTGFDDYMESRRKSYGVSEQLAVILKELNDIEKLKKFLTKYLTDDGNANTLGVKMEDGTYAFYKFDELIDYYLTYATVRMRAESIAIDINDNPSITMEFRSKGKKSLFIRQEYKKGEGSLKNILKNLSPVTI
jgi:hypothetical protein